jgi:hypothetical protein
MRRDVFDLFILQLRNVKESLVRVMADIILMNM